MLTDLYCTYYFYFPAQMLNGQMRYFRNGSWSEWSTIIIGVGQNENK